MKQMSWPALSMETKREYGFRLGEQYRRRHRGAGNIAKQHWNKDFDSHGRFQRHTPRTRPCTTHWSSTHKLQDLWLKAVGAKVAWRAKLMYVEICMMLKLNSFGTTLYETSTWSVQKVAQSLVLSVSTSLNLGMETLAKAVWLGVMLRTAAWHQTKTWQEPLTSWGARVVADTARVRKAEETNPVEWWKEGGTKDT